MRWTAGAHIIFCVDLKEESVLLPLGKDRRQMFVLEAGAHQTGNVMRRKAADGWHGQALVPRQFLSLSLRVARTGTPLLEALARTESIEGAGKRKLVRRRAVARCS